MEYVKNITTKTGDKGMTGLYAGGRVRKDDALIELLGELDELQAFVAWAGLGADGEILTRVVDDIYRLMSVVGFRGEIPEGIRDIGEEDLAWMEGEMEKFSEKVGDLREFIRPGGSEQAARLNLARTVCRRVERRFLIVDHQWGLKYLNRLSDLLFVLGYIEVI